MTSNQGRPHNRTKPPNLGAAGVGVARRGAGSYGLIWCATRTATVGLVVADGVIVDCPPYARRWALGRDARQVWRRQARAGAHLVWLPDRSTRIAKPRP